MYNVKVTNYLYDREIVVYDKPIHKHEKDLSSCVILKDDGFGYEVNKKDLFLSEDLKKNSDKIFSDLVHSAFVSHNRTKQKIYYYARANKWEWFFTFTFDQKKVDSFDYDEVTVVMSDWLNYMYHNNKSSDLKYLIVPEKHKSGAWHFHGVFSGLSYQQWRLMFSGKHNKGEPIYNVLSFPYGFTTATEVSSTKAVSRYICKYITKDVFDSLKNKKRYWVTKNCSLGNTETYFFTKDEIEMLLNSFGDPDFQKTVSTPYNEVLYYQFDT